MGWYRTGSGRLLYGNGGLAKVYVSRGYTPVADEVAEAEVASGEAQTRADVEGELAAEVDARAFETEKAAEGTGVPTEGIEVPPDGEVHDVELTGEAHPVPTEDGAGVFYTDPGPLELTPEQQADVDQAIAEEGPESGQRGLFGGNLR